MAKDYQQELDALRTEVAQLKQELTTLRAANPPPAPAIDRKAQHLAKLHAQLASAKQNGNDSLAAWLEEQIRLTNSKKG